MITEVIRQEFNLTQFACVFNQVHIFITATVEVFKSKARDSAFCFTDQVIHTRIIHVVFPGRLCWFKVLHQMGFKLSAGFVWLQFEELRHTTKISIKIEGMKKMMEQ